MRWKGFITLFVALAIFTGGTVLFAPRIIKSAVERVGTALWGAKVELEEVQLSYSPMAVRFKGFTVASRSEEYRNMMEVDRVAFSILVAPLLERKINIEEISGTGLSFGTERETSGFLPRRREKEEEEVTRWRQQLSEWLSAVKDRASERVEVPQIDTRQLSSFEKVEETQTRIEELEKKSQELKEKDGSGLAARLEKSIENLREIRIRNERDIARARERIEKIQDNIKEAEEFIDDINRTVGEFRLGVSEVRDNLNMIDEARRQDYRDIMDKLQLPSIEMEDIAETVFGPLIVERFNTFSGYLETVRRYIPPRDQKKRVSRPPRFKGEDIIFYREKMNPPFLVEKALLSGAGGEYVQLEDFSTAPWVLGRPSVASAAAGNFDIYASFDRGRETPLDLIKINYRNFVIDRSTGDLNLEAKLEGDRIDSDITWRGRGLLPRDWLEYIRLDDPQIEISVKVSGRRRSPAFNISSNIDRILSDRLKAELDRQIEEARRQVEGFIDGEILPRREALTRETDRLRRETEETVERERETVLARKREAEEEIEEKREEIEEFLKDTAKDAEERLRELFGR